MLAKESLHDQEREIPAIVAKEQRARTLTRRDFLHALGLFSAGVATGVAGLGERTLQHSVAHASKELVSSAEHQTRERLRITSTGSIFNRLREGNIFPEDHKWEITANAEAFYAIGRAFAERPSGGPNFDLDLLQQPEIHILVPASGILLSPLEIAFQLAEDAARFSRRSSAILERVHFTFTEIDEEAYQQIDQYVRMLVNACENTSDFSVRTETHPELAQSPDVHPAKKAMQFAYRTADERTVTISIDFELHMSGTDWVSRGKCRAS